MILVLGGLGFIGKNVCARLVKNGDNVISFDRTDNGHVPGTIGVKGDFFNDSELFSYVDRADVIVHCISTLSTNNAAREYLRGYQKDLVQTVKLFAYASERKKRVIFLSSGGTVYGNPTTIPTSESTIQDPISHYGALKLAMEKSAQVFNRTYGNNIICLRVANPYGPGQDFTRGIGFIDAVLKKGINGQTLSIWGDGSVVRDYIYIYDVADIISFFTTYQGNSCVFNIGTGVGTSQNEIIDIAKSLGLDIHVEYIEARTFDVKKNILECSRLFSVYPKPLKSLQDGVKEYYEYICAK